MTGLTCGGNCSAAQPCGSRDVGDVTGLGKQLFDAHGQVGGVVHDRLDIIDKFFSALRDTLSVPNGGIREGNSAVNAAGKFGGARGGFVCGIDRAFNVAHNWHACADGLVREIGDALNVAGHLRSGAGVAVDATGNALRGGHLIAGRLSDLGGAGTVALEQFPVADELAAGVALHVIEVDDIFDNVFGGRLACAGLFGATTGTFSGPAFHPVGDIPFASQRAILVTVDRVVVIHPVIDIRRRLVSRANRHHQAFAVVVASDIVKLVGVAARGGPADIQAGCARFILGQYPCCQHPAEPASVTRCMAGELDAFTLGVIPDRSAGLIEHIPCRCAA